MPRNATTTPARVRALLRSERGADGLSIEEITQLLAVPLESVRSALKSMPDTYVDRWDKKTGKYFGIWCIVTPPENCPRPTKENLDD